ncbi:MAG: hypothetical protein MSA33_03625 [Campylobacter sp.]|uniref:hypothetical protein n=1 Tax=Campylobacter sp. TaxID=205 RepID=UPI002AA76F07|nr:hypothetical protein [Campylobacter sp.]MCI7549524.1 hypothetical protein [Campylobacter sp.]
MIITDWIKYNSVIEQNTTRNYTANTADNVRDFVRAENSLGDFNITQSQEQKQIDKLSEFLAIKDFKSAEQALLHSHYEYAVNGTLTNDLYSKIKNLSEAEQTKLKNFMINNPILHAYNFDESRLAAAVKSDISIDDFKKLWLEVRQDSIDTNPQAARLVGGTPSKEAQERYESQKAQRQEQENKQEKADEIARKNRMLLRQYNGAKSRNLSLESKNEILKTFFEEFLKNNNPLAFLEIMKKTDIKA